MPVVDVCLLDCLLALLEKLSPQFGNPDKKNTNCKPITDIIFVKTHKTASTTTGTIIERYGYKHGLAFAIPEGNQIFDESRPFTHKMVNRTKPNFGNKFNIMANHLVFNKEELDRVIPNATYVSILRHPVKKFESTFGYYGIAEKMKLNQHVNPLEQFMKDPDKYMKKHEFKMKKQLRNGMMYNLGFNHRYDEDVDVINQTIAKLDKELDLVLLTDYYDESLILLKSRLCWEFEDILYISKGNRTENRRYKISPSLATKIEKWNQADVLLYEHFNETFWKKVNDYGPTFHADLEEFRKLQSKFDDECIQHGKTMELHHGSNLPLLRTNASTECQLASLRVVDFHSFIKKTD
ncbi:galactosylceramide sulfotransferase-like [Glandiceps talaboti]